MGVIEQTSPGAGASDAPDELPVDVLGARICALASRLAQATYRWLVMIAEFDTRGGWSGHGIKSCAHWLSWACSLAPGTAREHVRVARSLATLPLVSAEMAAGRLSYAKVREISRVSDRVDESYLVDLARTATASQLSRAVRGFRLAEGSRGRQELARTATWFTAEDGSVVISARLPAEEGAAVVAALETARDDLHRRAGDVTVPVERADMLLQLARGFLSASPEDRSGEDRTLVVVHVNAEHLAPGGNTTPCNSSDSDPAGSVRSGSIDAATRSRGNVSTLHPTSRAAGPTPGPAPAPISIPESNQPSIPVDTCQVVGVGGIESETAQRLACDATVVGIIRGAGGCVLNHGRRRRLVSPAQRRALNIRDGACQFPSCQRISHLEAHHAKHWARGGRTDMDNLVLLCRFHHVACHEGGIQVDAVPTVGMSGRPRWQFRTAQGEPLSGQRLQDAAPTDPLGWKGDAWILAHALDGSKGWNDPEARNIRPLWAGERFNLADTVSVLFARTTQTAA